MMHPKKWGKEEGLSDLPIKSNVRFLLSKLGDRNVAYCHWKSNEHLYEGLIGETDLDILVRKDDRNEFENIAAKEGFLRFNSQFGSRYTDVDDWIGMDEESGTLIHLHVHYRLATGHAGMKEYSLPWVAEILDSRKMWSTEDIYICSENYEIICLFTRIALKAKTKDIIKSALRKYKVEKSAAAEIEYLRKRINVSSVQTICRTSFSQSEDVCRFITNGSLDGFNLIRFRWLIKQDMRYHQICSGVNYLAGRMFFSPIVLIRSGLSHRFGMIFITRKTVACQDYQID